MADDEEGGVAEPITQQLVAYLQEAVAMEESVAESLHGMIETSGDPDTRALLEHHLLETQEHAKRLRVRLDAHGAGSSLAREIGGSLQSALKGVVDLARGDRPAHSARDAYVAEHLEIATYELLERVAALAGDPDTAAVARANRAEDEAMARASAERWDRIVPLALREAGIDV
jgi:ferritin-like metal-binding protein YciE